MQAQDLQNLISHADCKGNTRGSRTAGQADNVSVSRKQAHNPAQTEKRLRKKSHPDCDNRPATQDRCGGTTHDRKSPIISPDCENGKGVLDFTRNVRERANKTPLLAIRPQPRSRPGSACLPQYQCRTGNCLNKGRGVCFKRLATREWFVRERSRSMIL